MIQVEAVIFVKIYKLKINANNLIRFIVETLSFQNKANKLQFAF